MDIHPAIAKKLDELLARAKELVSSQQQGLEILAKTVDLKDYHGLKMRAAEAADVAAKLQWISAQIEALRTLPYDMAAEDMAPRRRSSQQAMAAVIPPPPEKKEG